MKTPENWQASEALGEIGRLTLAHAAKSLMDAVARFDDLACRAAGIMPRATPQHALDAFFACEPAQQLETVRLLTAYTNILEEANRSGIPLLGDTRLSLFAMKKLGLSGPAGFEHMVHADDFTEIYNAEGVQLFRNLEFYEITTYGIAEMSIFTWAQLYKRDPLILMQIINQGFVKGFSGIKTAYKLAISDHIVSETQSAEQAHFSISFSVLAPLVNQADAVLAVFATSSLRRLDPAEVLKEA